MLRCKSEKQERPFTIVSDCIGNLGMPQNNSRKWR